VVRNIIFGNVIRTAWNAATVSARWAALTVASTAVEWVRKLLAQSTTLHQQYFASVWGASLDDSHMVMGLECPYKSDVPLCGIQKLTRRIIRATLLPRPADLRLV
jgi:hypothetical protein